MDPVWLWLFCLLVGIFLSFDGHNSPQQWQEWVGADGECKSGVSVLLDCVSSGYKTGVKDIQFCFFCICRVKMFGCVRFTESTYTIIQLSLHHWFFLMIKELGNLEKKHPTQTHPWQISTNHKMNESQDLLQFFSVSINVEFYILFLNSFRSISPLLHLQADFLSC